MKHIAPLLSLALVLTLAFGMVACGQRVEPKAPAGKIIPSTAY